MKVSVFKNAMSVDPIDTDIGVILRHIQNAYWADKIAHLRTLDKAAYDEQKKSLPAVTFSGTFKKRSNDGLNVYSRIVCLDIDKLDEMQISRLKILLDEDPFVHFAFISPSGKGLKILVPVNTGPEHHLSAFLHLQKVFEEKYCMKVDDSGKDIARLCFISYDPSPVEHPMKAFEVDIRYGEVKKYVTPTNLQNQKPEVDTDKIFKLCVSWVEKTSTYAPGQRNRFVHSLACACNRVGLEMSVTENHIKSNYDLEQKEIDHCVKSAYFKNQSEHGSVEVKDIGVKEFMAPAWIMNYTDDVVVNDIMQTTCMLHSYKVPHDQIYHIMKLIGVHYHNKGFIDLRRNSLGKIMNQALETLNKKVVEETDSLTLKYSMAEDVLKDIIDINFDSSAIGTSFEALDLAIRGGLLPGCFYGVIGVGGTFKSILSQFIAFLTALNGKPALYLNGEMTSFQFYERLALMVINAKLYKLMKDGVLKKENMDKFISEMKEVINNNLFLVTGNGFSQKNIIATIDNIKAKTGKEIALVVIDGVSQMDNAGMQEIPAAIHNTAQCKELAKNANNGSGVVVLGLMHISGDNDKLLRDTGPRCRGGNKTTANMDGYFSTSLIASESNNSIDKQGTDIEYEPNKFFLKFVDKRGNGGVIDQIIKVNEDLRLQVESMDVNKYEIKINR